MSKLFSENIITKLKKLPDIAVYFILAVSFFIADAKSYISIKETVADTFRSLGESGILGTISEQSAGMQNTVFVFASLLALVIAVAIFEIIVRFAVDTLTRRFGLDWKNKKEFVAGVRLAFIYANIVLGLIGIFEFFFFEAEVILPAIFDFAVPALFLAFFYETYRKRSMPRIKQYVVFDFVAKFYLAIYVALSMFSLVFFLADGGIKTSSAIVSAAYFVDFAIKALFIAPYFLYGNKLKKEAALEEDNPLFMPETEAFEELRKRPFEDLDM